MKQKVLVMDDDVAICKIITLLLNRLGYDVECVSCGEECLVRYEQAFKNGTRYNVVILDLSVQTGMGGIETIKKLREFDPQVTAVMASGASMESATTSYRTHGFTAVLPKPFRFQDVTDCMQKVSPLTP
jgi:CheY-like chemotaxis protein